MKQNNKSGTALDMAFSALGMDKILAIKNKIEAKGVPGPTIEEYFSEFEAHFENLFENLCAPKPINTIYKVDKICPPKTDVVFRPSDTEWVDPEKNTLNKNNLTTVQNNGGFLFSLHNERSAACKICFN